MNPAEIFAAMPLRLAAEVLEFNHEHEKQVYRTALDAIAQARKVRPVFIAHLPRAEQHALLIGSLGRPQFAVAADALLRSWLVKEHVPILVAFLDALAIKHEQGVVEDIPKTVDDAALKNAVEALLTQHPHAIVAVYLAVFDSMNSGLWANLSALLREDPRLQLKRDG